MTLWRLDKCRRFFRSVIPELGICERPKSERFFAVALQGTSMVPSEKAFLLAGVVSRTCAG